MSQNKQANIAEMISAKRVQQLVAEEEEIVVSDTEVNKIKAQTVVLVAEMNKHRDAGNEAKRREVRNEIVILNLRLVTQVLKKYGYFSQDKFQNGCIGLLKAAETFNDTKGIPFYSYGCFCIETEIRLAFKKENRLFESKTKGFLDSLDAPVSDKDGAEMDKHDLAADPFGEQEFDEFIQEAEIDELFYEVIIPCIEQYGTRSKDIDMELWKQLEIQYFIELSMESSQQQRLTLSEMANRLGTVTQNLRSRHKKVMELIRKELRMRGYNIAVSSNGRARVVKTDFPLIPSKSKL